MNMEMTAENCILSLIETVHAVQQIEVALLAPWLLDLDLSTLLYDFKFWIYFDDWPWKLIMTFRAS